MKRLTPILYVPSIEEAVTFYGRLGFGLEFAMNGEDRVNGQFLLLPDVESLQKILESIRLA